MGISGERKGAARQYNRSKVPRLRWTAELHRSFVRAIDCLGGQQNMQPQLHLKQHSFGSDEQSPKEFMCPPIKRAKAPGTSSMIVCDCKKCPWIGGDQINTMLQLPLVLVLLLLLLQAFIRHWDFGCREEERSPLWYTR
uniref:Uncharacterized protein n=1 Tax=Oryza sativa subsp. japonica TaxID=39947 RepID=Q6EU13_ORYSJ|nr:hypothetical protein [Oryza sativa Japonica Group]BAD27857.1 hypothetical protein [Oryza sativa Japonica Group]